MYLIVAVCLKGRDRKRREGEKQRIHSMYYNESRSILSCPSEGPLDTAARRFASNDTITAISKRLELRGLVPLLPKTIQ